MNNCINKGVEILPKFLFYFNNSFRFKDLFDYKQKMKNEYRYR